MPPIRKPPVHFVPPVPRGAACSLRADSRPVEHLDFMGPQRFSNSQNWKRCAVTLPSKRDTLMLTSYLPLPGKKLARMEFCYEHGSFLTLSHVDSRIPRFSPFAATPKPRDSIIPPTPACTAHASSSNLIQLADAESDCLG